jgi:uroporphyrinogen-III synthase
MSATEVTPRPDGRREASSTVLAGYTVAVTAARRREELGSLLERRGARVVYAPAIRIVPLEDDAELVAATRACLAAPLDIAIATTGIGFRGWVEAADGWGLADDLLDQLGRARVYARGPKARGAIRAVGLREEWSPDSESSAEVLAHLRQEDVAGLRVVVQLHGEPLTEVVDGLRAAGAEVLTVPVYRWLPPDDLGPLERLVDALLDGGVDCVTFTSAPAAACLLQLAERRHQLDEVVAALADVLVVCVGSVTATPLTRHGVTVSSPDRARLGALARHVVQELPARSPELAVAGHRIQVRGHAVVLDGEVRPITPGPLAVLRELARRPGSVRSRAELGAVLPGPAADEHAVEMAVTRLRAGLGDPALVQTVVKRGYRLAVPAPQEEQG